MKELRCSPTGYESDLTNNQWEKIAKYFPMGNKGSIHKRLLVEAVLYLVKAALPMATNTTWLPQMELQLNRL